MGTRHLRWLALTSWVVFVASYFIPEWFVSKDPALLQLSEWDGYGALFQHNLLFAAPMLLILFATVGIVFYQNWGRYLYLVTAAYFLATSFLFGYRVGSPIEVFFGGLSNMLIGMILSLVFFSPLRTAFGHKDGP